MNFRSTIFALGALAIFLISCNSRIYNNEAFLNQNSIEGKSIAILPVDVTLSGRLPKGFTEFQKNKQEETESKLFQEMLYSEFLSKSRDHKKNKYKVNFINPQDINAKLMANEIIGKKISDYDSQNLARILGADMIFLVKVKKDRLMSDGAAIGIDIAEGVLNSILNPRGNNSNINNTEATKTYNIAFDATLIDGNSGTTISKLSNIREANWRETPEIIIRRNYGKFTRRSMIYAGQ